MFLRDHSESFDPIRQADAIHHQAIRFNSSTYPYQTASTGLESGTGTGTFSSSNNLEDKITIGTDIV